MTSLTKRLSARVVAVAVLGAAVAAAATAGSTAVSFTTPKPGSTLSLRVNPYTAVAGNVTFAAATPQTARFYLRRDGCGTSNDNPHLSTASGTDGGDGCGIVLDSVVGVGGDADQSAFVDFPSTDGMPLALDAGRTATGVIDITGTAAGAVEVDVSLEALVNGQGVALGSDTETFVLDPTRRRQRRAVHDPAGRDARRGGPAGTRSPRAHPRSRGRRRVHGAVGQVVGRRPVLHRERQPLGARLT